MPQLQSRIVSASFEYPRMLTARYGAFCPTKGKLPRIERVLHLFHTDIN